MPDCRQQPRLWQAISLLLCLLAACQPLPTPQIAPQPTPRVLTVQATPALQSFTGKFHACAGIERPSIGLVVSNTPAPSLDINKADIALRWGVQFKLEGYAAELGKEALVIVVSPQHAGQSIQLSDLQAIYQGKLRAWPGASSEVHAWTYPGGDDAAQVFEGVVLGGGQILGSAVYTAPDPAAMLEAVSKDLNAVGYLPRGWLNDSVKSLDVQGIAPETMRQPVIALSKSEPEGPEKSWLICLQQGFSE